MGNSAREGYTSREEDKQEHKASLGHGSLNPAAPNFFKKIATESVRASPAFESKQELTVVEPVQASPISEQLDHEAPPWLPDRRLLIKRIREGFLAAAESGQNPMQVIIAPMRGYGKTHLALEFSHSDHYDTVYQVSADAKTLLVEFFCLAESLGIKTKGLELPKVQELVHAALAKELSWLLIFTNAENSRSLTGYLPKGHGATQHVLITSLSTDWPKENQIILSPFSQLDSDSYIRHFVQKPKKQDLNSLGVKLYHVPLALFYAVVYMKKVNCSIEHYLRHYRGFFKELKAVTEEAPDKNKQDVLSKKQAIFTTCRILLMKGIQENKKISPETFKQVNRCLALFGYLYSEGITKEILQAVLKIEPTVLEEALTILKEYSLITLGEMGFEIHPIVQEFARWKDTEEEVDVLEQRLKPLAESLVIASRSDSGILKARLLQPHVQTILEHLEPSMKSLTANEDQEILADLYAVLGEWSLNAFRDLKKSEVYYSKALKIRLSIDAGNPDKSQIVADTYSKLGSVKYASDHPKAAIDYHTKALAIRLKIYQGMLQGAPDFIDIADSVATSYNHLGEAHRILGDNSNLRKAFDYHTLAMRERSSIYKLRQGVDEQISLAISYNNLGLVHRALGNTQEALDSYATALNMFSKIGQEGESYAIKVRQNIEILAKKKSSASQVHLNSVFNTTAPADDAAEKKPVNGTDREQLIRKVSGGPRGGGKLSCRVQ